MDLEVNANSWPAPAKLNLLLHITGRRADGYHNLQTVFQFLQLQDDLDFRVTQDGKVNLLSNYDGISPEVDLVFRAARLLQKTAGTEQGATISILKRIPVGGGLGGGSSDAATTLVALNQIWRSGFSQQKLAEIGLELGADVPVFIAGQAAWAEGVGEKLEPVNLVQDWFLVIYPGCQVGTAAVFNMPELTRNSTPITIRDFLAGAGHNDCENVVFRQYPEVAKAAKWLGRRTTARLTGTGSCVFGRFENEHAAREVLAGLPSEWQGFVSRGCNRSPLQKKLEQARHQIA